MLLGFAWHVVIAGSPPQLNVTVCVEPLMGVTVIVICPDWPATMESEEGDALTEKSCAPWTTCMNTADVLGANVVSPLYCAVIECEPAASDDVANVAVALVSATGWPSATPLSKKVTVPVGVPCVEDVTVAVSVTD